jgi:hypothetical protein
MPSVLEATAGFRLYGILDALSPLRLSTGVNPPPSKAGAAGGPRRAHSELGPHAPTIATSVSFHGLKSPKVLFQRARQRKHGAVADTQFQAFFLTPRPLF